MHFESNVEQISKVIAERYYFLGPMALRYIFFFFNYDLIANRLNHVVLMNIALF